MASIVQFVLFIHFFFKDVQLSSTTTIPAAQFTNAPDYCSLYNSTVEDFETPIREAQCKHFHLSYVNFTESSQELFLSITKRSLVSLGVHRSFVDTFRLPHNLTILNFDGTPGCTTKFIIDEVIKYKIQQLTLDGLPQLPANIDKLRSLTRFVCYRVDDLDFTIFSEMLQLDYIRLSDIGSVTIPISMQLLTLQWLAIYHSLVTFDNNSSLKFPILGELHLYNNSLQEMPIQITTFTSLKYFSFCSNYLQRVTLDMFANLSQLVVLDLTDNQISEITSENQVKLLYLRELSLASNKLTSLNVTLWIMPALQFFSIDNNQLYRVEGLLELFTGTLREFIWRVNNSVTFIANDVGGCPSNKWKHPSAKAVADKMLSPI